MAVGRRAHNFFLRSLQHQTMHLSNPPPTIRFPSSTLNKCLHHRLSHYPTSHVCTATSPGFRFRGWVQNKVSAHDICCCLYFSSLIHLHRPYLGFPVLFYQYTLFIDYVNDVAVGILLENYAFIRHRSASVQKLDILHSNGRYFG